MDTEEAVRSIGESFERLAGAARRAARTAAAQLDPDLPPGAWPVFVAVLRGGRVQPSALVAALGLDKSAVSRHLKELRERGLVEAVRDEHDARSLWITPTAGAVERAETGAEERRAGMRERLAGWDTDDLTRFAELLDRFADPEWLRG